MAYKLILVRHGQSVWNKDNRFTGWKDVELTDRGVSEAKAAGVALKEAGLDFDLAYTSVLKRAIKTLWLIQEQMDLMWVPVHRSWRLNERHYGALTGLNKSETAAKHGEEQVLIWRRSYATPPPLLEEDDAEHPKHDPRYQGIPSQDLPRGEALLQTKQRVMPIWENHISSKILEGQRVIIAAHGNSLRALIQHLEDLTEEEIMGVNVPTGIPLIYELDGALKPTNKYYLGDDAQVKAAMHEVASQGQSAESNQ